MVDIAKNTAPATPSATNQAAAKAAPATAVKPGATVKVLAPTKGKRATGETEQQKAARKAAIKARRSARK